MYNGKRVGNVTDRVYSKDRVRHERKILEENPVFHRKQREANGKFHYRQISSWSSLSLYVGYVRVAEPWFGVIVCFTVYISS